MGIYSLDNRLAKYAAKLAFLTGLAGHFFALGIFLLGVSRLA
jgi:hypothetical protein